MAPGASWRVARIERRRRPHRHRARIPFPTRRASSVVGHVWQAGSTLSSGIWEARRSVMANLREGAAFQVDPGTPLPSLDGYSLHPLAHQGIFHLVHRRRIARGMQCGEGEAGNRLPVTLRCGLRGRRSSPRSRHCEQGLRGEAPARGAADPVPSAGSGGVGSAVRLRGLVLRLGTNIQGHELTSCLCQQPRASGRSLHHRDGGVPLGGAEVLLGPIAVE